MKFKKTFVLIVAILSIFFVSSCKKKQATIEFLPGMGNQTMDSIQVDMNSEYVLPTPTFTYEGYTFDCWVLSSDATQTFKVGDTFVVG